VWETVKVISKLKSDSQKRLEWFANNLMQANPDKFQALAIGKNTFKEQICFDLNGSKVFYQTNNGLINL
jgi:hypothetical protein